MFFAPTTHAVEIGDDLVLLDILADRYLCLPEGAAFGLSGDRRTLQACSDVVSQDLAEAGLAGFEPSPPTCLARPMPTTPVSDLCHPCEGPIVAEDRSDLVHAAIDARWLYPRRSFADLVAFAGSHTSEALIDEEPPEAMKALVGRFHRWSGWIPAPSKCLIRSYVLLRLLRRRGFDARWVFAVRTWPFEAHCWLQCGGAVLDDVPERLVAFHPILVA